MAGQVLNPIHPVCQPVFDRVTDLTATVQILRLLAETDDEQDAHRAARYLGAAVAMAAEDISAMNIQPKLIV